MTLALAPACHGAAIDVYRILFGRLSRDEQPSTRPLSGTVKCTIVILALVNKGQRSWAKLINVTWWYTSMFNLTMGACWEATNARRTVVDPAAPCRVLNACCEYFGYDATNHVKPKFACPKVTPLGRKHNKFKLQNLRSALIDHTQQPPQSNCQSLFQMEYFFRGVSRVSAGHPRLPGSPMFHSKILQVHRSTMFKG